MNILFLYTELAGYTLACFRALKERGANIFVVHYPVNSEAPFLFDFESVGEFKNISNYLSFQDLKSDIENFKPQKIVVSGWSNKWYMRYCIFHSRDAELIITMDNHWNGAIKQRLLAAASKFTLSRWFNKIWVPGQPQIPYAKKMGFLPANIMTGFYSCDVDRFSAMRDRFLEAKKNHFPRVILCAARYIPAKNYNILWRVFIQWKKEYPNDWQLWCAGTGEGFEERIEHPDIKHLGFVQGADWLPVIKGTGVFVLPSLFEPWGVAVHEFSISGYPLILSNKVGAGSIFLNQDNGWSFEPESVEELLTVFKNLGSKSDAELIEMGNRSFQMGLRLTPEKWAETLLVDPC